MFDRCQIWRHHMNRLAEGDLPPKRRAALQNHLSRCARCRSLSEADTARRAALQCPPEMLSSAASRAFDDSVVAALRAAVAPEPPTFAVRVRRLVRSLPTDFFQQMAGGALAASAVTIVCLFSALHPKTFDAQRSAPPAQAAPNDPPVALESLLRAHSPRAALLWSAPTAGTGRVPHPAPVVHRARPKNSDKQGAAGSAARLG